LYVVVWHSEWSHSADLLSQSGRLWSHASHCEMCGGQSGTGTAFYSST